RLLGGGRFYYDVFDPDPPLIFLLLEPSAGFAKLTGLDPYVVFSGWVCLLILWSIVEAAGSLLGLFAERRGAGIIAVLTYATLLCFLPGYQFGQRDHLAIVLLSPWLFRFALRKDVAKESLTFSSLSITAIAAVGFLIKPYFIVLPI